MSGCLHLSKPGEGSFPGGSNDKVYISSNSHNTFWVNKGRNGRGCKKREERIAEHLYIT